MIRSYILLAVAILFNGVANVLMKAGMQNAPEVTGLGAMIKHYLTSWPVIVGLVLFAINIVAWTQALTKLPLSMAYPVMLSMSLLIGTVGAMLFFKESLSWIQMIGFALIISGVVCVTR